MQRSLLFPGAAFGTGAPPAAPAWGASVPVATPDGEILHALDVPAPRGRATVLFFHGNADSIDNYAFLAEALAARDIGLFAISYRGYGGSTGSPSETGLLNDGLAAYDLLAARGSDRVIVLGQSLGSAVAVHVAQERTVAGVVLVSPFDSAVALARAAYPLLPVGPLMRDPFRSDQRIARVRAPLLFLHGDRDTVVPIRFGQALFALAPQPKEIRILSGRGHNDLWTPELVEAIANFAIRHGAQ